MQMQMLCAFCVAARPVVLSLRINPQTKRQTSMRGLTEATANSWFTGLI
jgi:hypothetical protein